MRCAVCQGELAEDAVFCHRCGARLDVPAESPPGPPAVDRTPSQNAGGPSPGGRLAPDAAPAADDPEKELWQGGYCWRAVLGQAALLGILSVTAVAVLVTMDGGSQAWTIGLIALALAWIGLYGVVLYRQLRDQYHLTSHRFVHRRGILRRVTDRLEVIDIDDISVEQSLVNRLVGVGTVRITSSDRSHPVLSLPGVDDVERLAAVFDDARRAERRRRGIHVEMV